MTMLNLGLMMHGHLLSSYVISKLKTQIDKVVSENSGKFSSVNRLSLLVPCDALTSPDSNAAASPKSGNEMSERSLYIAYQHASEYNMGDLFMPGSAVSSHSEETVPPDKIRSTGHPQVGGSFENKKKSILIHNQAYDEELHNFERIMSRLTEKPQISTRKLDQDVIPPLEAQKTDLPTKNSVPHSQPSTSRSNKREWGRQKSRSGRWTHRS